MAMDYKKLGIRSASAAGFVVVLLSCLLYSYYSFSIFFFLIALWGLAEYYKLGKALGFEAYKIPGFLGAVLIYFSFVQFALLGTTVEMSSNFLLGLCVLPALVLVAAVFDSSAKPFSNAVFTLSSWLYVILPFALLNKLVGQYDQGALRFEPKFVLGMLLLIWSNDTFAYLGGSFFGKHKMIERVSPGKTWEGTIIGVVVTFALSFLLPNMLHIESTLFWSVAGLAVPVLATLGDLLESVLKRQAGVKDSGNVMPGHGGILDRFDSLIFVTPFMLLLQLLMA